jgi:predicted nuclease of predicted toxin-antitoxin system
VKLLLDQNISFRVANKLQADFPECSQVRELILENKTDREIWNFAKTENYTIVTFDADFYDLVTLFGHPPKVIWLRMGNTSSDHLIEVLQSHSEIIGSFVTDSNYSNIGCLEII